MNIVVIFQPFASQSSPNFGNMQETLYGLKIFSFILARFIPKIFALKSPQCNWMVDKK